MTTDNFQRIGEEVHFTRLQCHVQALRAASGIQSKPQRDKPVRAAPVARCGAHARLRFAAHGKYRGRVEPR